MPGPADEARGQEERVTMGQFECGRYQDPNEVLAVNNKMNTKKYLAHHGIAVPETLAVLPGYSTLPDNFLDGMPEKFVIKPHDGAQGRDIFILTRVNGELLEPDGKVHTKEEITEHIMNLMRYKKDVIIEKKIEPHPELAKLSPYGTMPDFRFYFAGNKPLFGLMRTPTKKSRGYGNVFRGAMLLVANADGVIHKSRLWMGGDEMVNPDTGFDFEGTKVPMWEEMLLQVRKVPPLFNSRLVCVDGVLDVNGVFVVPEVTLGPSFWTFVGWDYMLKELEEGAKPPVAVPIYKFLGIKVRSYGSH